MRKKKEKRAIKKKEERDTVVERGRAQAHPLFLILSTFSFVLVLKFHSIKAAVFFIYRVLFRNIRKLEKGFSNATMNLSYEFSNI